MFTQSDLPTLHKMQSAATRIRNMIHRRAVVEYHLAFGTAAAHEDHLDMCVIHNSINALQNGNPWPEVNYQHMRKAAWLCEQSYKPHRLVDRWYSRKWRAR